MKPIYWSSLLFVYLVSATHQARATDTSRQCAVTQVSPTDVLNIRSAPNYRSKQLGTIAYNATSILKLGPIQTDGKRAWVKIRYQTTTGWVNSKFLTCQPSAADVKAALTNRARNAVLALRAQDMARFATYVHPQQGVRFSPYAYVNTRQDLTYHADQVTTLLSDTTPKRWGDYDGSGKPILLTFAMYFHQFIYDRDFANASEIGYNHTIRAGTIIDNSRSVYPQGIMIDFHAASNPGGMDWASLRLMFEEFNGKWYIVGVIHDHWNT